MASNIYGLRCQKGVYIALINQSSNQSINVFALDIPYKEHIEHFILTKLVEILFIDVQIETFPCKAIKALSNDVILTVYSITKHLFNLPI